jgi:UDP-2,3-diacylglucosamine hydrolase
VRFLRGFGNGDYDRLICAGDLFDFWFEYRHVCFSDYFHVLRAFADLREAGVELHLACGNHDFWAGRFLRDEIGFQIHLDPAVLDFDGKRALLFHGDGLNSADRSYLLYKRFARNPLVIGAFRLIHPDLAMRIAQGVSHGSRTLLGVEKPAEGPEARALREYAKMLFSRGEADIIICGHAHAGAFELHPTPNGEGLYINPGDWRDSGSHIVWQNGEFSPREWRDG